MSAGKEWWRPQSLASRRGNLDKRARIVAALRVWFGAQGFTEVETPCLQISPGLEPHLRAFAAALIDPWGGPDSMMYLHTSPEFAMKKLLCGGMERIFQLARVFRNAETGPTHSPEFTMLEWYRAGGTIDDMMEDVENLVRGAAQAAGVLQLRRGDCLCDVSSEWERISVADAFRRWCGGMDVLSTAPDPAAPDVNLIRPCADRLNISHSPSDRWDDIFFKIMMEKIEPHLGMDRPTILHSYPASMAALARPSPADPRVAERFEAYACGIELCNAFGELTDSREQKRRFHADMDLKQQLYGERYPIDDDFIDALAAGMPESAGCALGLDRLVMLICGADTLAEVLWLPVMPAVHI